MSTAAEHYDAQARIATGQRTDMQRFHNEAKRQLLRDFAFQAPRLLDVACGRGGDIHKWRALCVAEVKGLDVSADSIAEAVARASKSRHDTTITFEQADLTRPWTDGTTYDVVSCFFALHYFFESEETANALMATVSSALKPGGAFIGIVASGRAILERLKYSDTFENDVVTVRAQWTGPPRCFGCAYTFAARDTVTEGSSVPEYLVFSNVLAGVAKLHGLEPTAVGGTAFDTATGDLHTLKPPYSGAESEVTEIMCCMIPPTRATSSTAVTLVANDLQAIHYSSNPEVAADLLGWTGGAKGSLSTFKRAMDVGCGHLLVSASVSDQGVHAIMAHVDDSDSDWPSLFLMYHFGDTLTVDACMVWRGVEHIMYQGPPADLDVDDAVWGVRWDVLVSLNSALCSRLDFV